jgi:hypothetical protein
MDIFLLIVTAIFIGNIVLQKKLDRMDRTDSKENCIDVDYEVLSETKIGFFKRQYYKIETFIYHYLYIH